MTFARVVGSGLVPFSKEATQSVDLLGADAVRAMFAADPALEPAWVQAAYFGSAKGGSLIGQRSLRFTGLANGLPVFNVENACASSAVAFHLAWKAVIHDEIDCALVVGVDRLSTLGGGALPVQDTEWDGAVGVTNPVVYAMRATRYMHDTGATPRDLAAVAVKARRFAAANPNAHMRQPVTIDEVLASRLVAEPLTLFQCSPKSDGAAAVLLMSDAAAARRGLGGSRVRASVVKSGTFSLAERDITRPDITQRAASDAYAAAAIGPADLDVVELHDAFSIAELLYCEELGLCADGGAAEFLTSGASASLEPGRGALVNPSGGLIGRGHPIGATGAAQIAELDRQLQGRAGAVQRGGARIGLAHVTGGGASGFDNGACAVTVLTAD